MSMKDHSTAEKPRSIFNIWKRKEEFLELATAMTPLFQYQMRDHEFQSAGTFYAESLAFLAMCKLENIDVILESGMSKGNSTEIWAKNFPGKVITFEHHRKPHHDDVLERLQKRIPQKALYCPLEVHFQDAFDGFQSAILEHSNCKIALFIDGPKDHDAMALAVQSFNYPNVVFAGIHDVANPVTKTRENYGFMKYFRYHLLSTDEPEFREKFGFLDETITSTAPAWILDENGEKIYSSDPKAVLSRFPNGPGIGFAINEQYNADEDFDISKPLSKSCPTRREEGEDLPEGFSRTLIE